MSLATSYPRARSQRAAPIPAGGEASARPAEGPVREVSIVGYPSRDESPLYCANTTALTGVLGGHEGGGTVPEVSYSAVMGDRAAELYREASGIAIGIGIG